MSYDGFIKEHRSHYLRYAKNIFSQNGEDGVIEELFKDLDISGGVVCEFGAWDGIWLSNIANLYLKNENYQAILIESDGNRCGECLELLKNYDNVEVYNCMVSYDKDSETSLDNILKLSDWDLSPDNFSLLSIDIDSSDYYVFESLERYSPKVVVIETSGLDYESITYNNGCSLKSVNKLGISKGYSLVCHTGNAFFVRNDLIHKLPDKDYSVENLSILMDEIMSFAEAAKPDGTLGSYNVERGEVYYLSPEYSEFVNSTKNKLRKGEKL